MSLLSFDLPVLSEDFLRKSADFFPPFSPDFLRFSFVSALVFASFTAKSLVRSSPESRSFPLSTSDEIALRTIEDTLEKLNVLAARKNTILKTVQEQGVLTDALKKQIEACANLRDLEIIYLPFKPKRRTRATIARERGLQPLADVLLKQETVSQTRQQILQPYVNPKREVPDTATALAGAMDIVAEHWAENPETRTWLADKAMKFGKVTSKVKRGKKTNEGADKFEQNFEREE